MSLWHVMWIFIACSMQAVIRETDMTETHYAPTSMGMLRPLTAFLDDPDVNEILMNESGIVFVEKKALLKNMKCQP